jgi:ATP-dependent Lon protease
MSLFEQYKMHDSDFNDDEPEFMPLMSLDEDEGNNESYPEVLPILPLKNTVLFPGIIMPITVGRDKSIRAIQKAYEGNRLIATLAQTDSKVENPSKNDLYGKGTVARIMKILRMPDGTTTAILQGRKRFELMAILKDDPAMEGEIRLLEHIKPVNPMEFDIIVSSIKETAKQIIELSPGIPSEAAVVLGNISNNSFLLNFIASNLGTKTDNKQVILETDDLQGKAERILKQMDADLQLLELKDQIESKVRTDLEKQQRDYFLNQQIKTIQEELGQNTQEDEIIELSVRADKKKWSKDAGNAFDKEMQRLRRSNPQVAEYNITLTYLENLLDLPWEEYTKDNFNLKKVKDVLDKDHFGLDKVKERILEHLAVLKLKGDMKAPILCLVGPPGVGKTSLGKSIAKALKRKFIRMSLGGVHDEAEIRGHRKTYIGAMPGRILQSLKKAKSSNPVFILDEIDKLSRDFRGDPSSALLEVLDPEQNNTFHDNYLEVDYDLSKVLFIATANSLGTIQPALLDRMEIIEIAGYSVEEKVEIAKRHLLAEQRTEHGLKPKDVKLGNESIVKLIESYTRESGVRSLNRQIASVMRAVAKRVAMDEKYNVNVKPEEIRTILGPELYSNDMYQENQGAGVAIGLAWTSVGGDILFVEVSLNKGNGKLTLTGSLGDVIKESATTALSFLKANTHLLGIDTNIFNEKDIHIHLPEGGIPKDGPSAGITMLSALASAFTSRPLKSHLAMTGEITLRGKVLPVGGIKEKILAAKRAGIKTIIMCKENKKNVDEVEKSYIQGITFHYTESMQEVLELALEK